MIEKQKNLKKDRHKSGLNLRQNELFVLGARDGIPIGLGYFAVAFSIGIAAKKVGMSIIQGFIFSVTCIASAGEYAAIEMMSVGAGVFEMICMMLVANSRYLLMSFALNQKFSKNTGFLERFIVSAFTTDELFAIAVARPGHIKPVYSYGAILVSIPLWALGTVSGIIAGNILPSMIVSALSVAIFGMFLALIIPTGKTNKVVGVFIVISFIWSFMSQYVLHLVHISSGMMLLVSTVVISAIAAYLRPVKEEEENAES